MSLQNKKLEQFEKSRSALERKIIFLIFIYFLKKKLLYKNVYKNELV